VINLKFNLPKKIIYCVFCIFMEGNALAVDIPDQVYLENIPLSLEGMANPGFVFKRSEDGSITGFINTKSLASLNFNLGVPVYVPTRISSEYTGSKEDPLKWNNPIYWDNPSFVLANIPSFFSSVLKAANTDINTWSSLVSTIESIDQIGPTEKFLGIKFGTAKVFATTSDTIPLVNSALKIGVNLKYDIQIGSNQFVDMNQKAVLERLRVKYDGHLSGHKDMFVKNFLENQGVIDNLQGKIGDGGSSDYFYNFGSGVANVTGDLSLNGNLQNLGEINLKSGTFLIEKNNVNSGAKTDENQQYIPAGKINIDGGVLKNVETFTNFGEINLNSGAIISDKPFVNIGKLNWYGGSINGAGVINVSNSAEGFKIMGDERKSISTIIKQNAGTPGVLTNQGMMTQVGDSSIYFDSYSGGSYKYYDRIYSAGGSAPPELNNEGTYILDGDGDLKQGTEYKYGSRGVYAAGSDLGDGVFNNKGTFIKASGTGTSIIESGIDFNNTGIIDVNSGTLNVGTINNNGIVNVNKGDFIAGSLIDTNGVFNLAEDRKLVINGGHSTDTVFNLSKNSTTSLSSSINGTLKLNGEEANFNATNLTVVNGESASIKGNVKNFHITGKLGAEDGNLSLDLDKDNIIKLSGGSVGGAGTTTNKNKFEWHSGSIVGSGGLTNESNNFKIMGDERKSISTIIKQNSGTPGVLTNQGMMTQVGDSSIYFDSYSGGSYKYYNRIYSASGSAPPELNNEGTYILDGDGDLKQGIEYKYGSRGVYAAGSDLGDGVFNNKGTFIKSSGTGTSIIESGIDFNNTGIIDVNSGTLNVGTINNNGIVNVNKGDFIAGSLIDTNGVFNLAEDRKLVINGGHSTDTVFNLSKNSTTSLSSSINGTLKLNGEEANFNATNLTVVNGESASIKGNVKNFHITGKLGAEDGNLSLDLDKDNIIKLSGGSVGGAGTTTNKNKFEWHSGSIVGSGGLTNESNNFKIMGDERKSISTIIKQNSGTPGVLTNQGMMTQVGDSSIYFDSYSGGSYKYYNRIYSASGSAPPELNNEGTYILDGDGDLKQGIEYKYGSRGVYAAGSDLGDGVFNNKGTFIKSSGTGTSIIESGIDFNNTGIIDVNSGTLNVKGEFYTDGIVNVSEKSTLILGNNYVQKAGNTKVNGSLVANKINIEGGILSGGGEFFGDISVSGVISPGNSPGSIDIHGDFELLSGGEMLIEIGGYNFDQFDQITVYGGATFDAGSMITFNFINDFSPLELDYFDFFISDNLTLDLDNMVFNILGLDNGFLFDIQIVDSSIRFQAINYAMNISNLPSQVPIPNSFILFLFGLISMYAYKRHHIIN